MRGWAGLDVGGRSSVLVVVNSHGTVLRQREVEMSAAGRDELSTLRVLGRRRRDLRPVAVENPYAVVSAHLAQASPPVLAVSALAQRRAGPGWCRRVPQRTGFRPAGVGPATEGWDPRGFYLHTPWMTMSPGKWTLAEARAVYDLPVETYVGLTLAEARDAAKREGRAIRVKDNLDHVGRASFGFRRVNVTIGSDGRVLTARKDKFPGWLE